MPPGSCAPIGGAAYEPALTVALIADSDSDLRRVVERLRGSKSLRCVIVGDGVAALTVLEGCASPLVEESAPETTGLVMDADRRTVTRSGRSIDLTRTEFELLELLVMNADIVLHRSTLYREIWGHDFAGESKALDVHISCLRKKLEAAGEPRIIQTVRGVGYALRPALGNPTGGLSRSS